MLLLEISFCSFVFKALGFVRREGIQLETA